MAGEGGVVKPSALIVYLHDCPLPHLYPWDWMGRGWVSGMVEMLRKADCSVSGSVQCVCGGEWTELAAAPTQGDSLVAQNVREQWLRMGLPGLALAGGARGGCRSTAAVSP